MAGGMSVRSAAERVSVEPAAKVLLVDDDLRDLKYYGAILRSRGYEVVTCSSYAEGVDRLQREGLDFVIVGQGGPNFEGRSVLERAIEIDRHRPVLVLTPRLDMHCYLDAMQLGAVDYLQKHVHPADLVWVVETHLQRVVAQEPKVLNSWYKRVK